MYVHCPYAVICTLYSMSICMQQYICIDYFECFMHFSILSLITYNAYISLITATLAEMPFHFSKFTPSCTVHTTQHCTVRVPTWNPHFNFTTHFSALLYCHLFNLQSTFQLYNPVFNLHPLFNSAIQFSLLPSPFQLCQLSNSLFNVTITFQLSHPLFNPAISCTTLQST